jgi:hypothetical protein
MALNVFSTKKNDVMKNFKKISALVTCMILLLSSILIGQHRPPDHPCWDMGNMINWGHWDDDVLECIVNPPFIENPCWIGCDNTNIDPD